MRSIKAGEDFVLYKKLADTYEPYVTIPSGEAWYAQSDILVAIVVIEK